jgi:hypothetical protein
MLVYGRPIDHHETDREKTDIRYTDEEDARQKIKEGAVVFEFLYKYDK